MAFTALKTLLDVDGCRWIFDQNLVIIVEYIVKTCKMYKNEVPGSGAATSSGVNLNLFFF